MSDLFKKSNINKYDPSDPANVKIHDTGISKLDDEQRQTVPFKGKCIDSRKLLFARAMQLLEEDYLPHGSTNLSHLSAAEKEFFYLFKSLLDSLYLLCDADLSENSTYLQQLSSIWHGLDVSIKRRQKQKTAPPYLTVLNDLTRSIEEYSTGGATFGYYLKEHLNSSWFPVPYMQMLSLLHKNYVNEKEQSLLAGWITKTSTLLGQILDQ